MEEFGFVFGEFWNGRNHEEEGIDYEEAFYDEFMFPLRTVLNLLNDWGYNLSDLVIMTPANFALPEYDGVQSVASIVRGRIDGKPERLLSLHGGLYTVRGRPVKEEEVSILNYSAYIVRKTDVPLEYYIFGGI